MSMKHPTVACEREEGRISESLGTCRAGPVSGGSQVTASPIGGLTAVAAGDFQVPSSHSAGEWRCMLAAINHPPGPGMSGARMLPPSGDVSLQRP